MSGICGADHKITKDEVTALPITAHDFHGEWNYTVHPHRPGN